MKKSKKTGPKPEQVKIDKSWEDAMKDAMKKMRPIGGWPDSKPKKPKKD